jgi:hypothetical protein
MDPVFGLLCQRCYRAPSVHQMATAAEDNKEEVLDRANHTLGDCRYLILVSPRHNYRILRSNYAPSRIDPSEVDPLEVVRYNSRQNCGIMKIPSLLREHDCS